MPNLGPQTSNTFAVIVTYNPDAEITSRIASILPHAAEAVIVDNGSQDNASVVDELVAQNRSITKIENRENLGVAAALNQGIGGAIERGFAWILTMDQDSRALPELLTLAQQAYFEFSSPEKIGVIGADYDGPFHFKKVQRYPAVGAYREMPTVITSGSLVSASVFQTIGPFRDDFFIDSVDDEYCLRLRREGYAVIESTGFGIAHKIGQPKIVRLLGKPRSTSNHSPVRRYYMARNRLVLSLRYLFQDTMWSLFLLKSVLRETFFVILFEEQKLAKLKATFLGIRDAVFGRMGKLNERRLGSVTTN